MHYTCFQNFPDQAKNSSFISYKCQFYVRRTATHGSDELKQIYIIILYLKFKLSNQNIVFLPRDKVVSPGFSL